MRKRTFSMDSALESKTQRSTTTIVPQPFGPGPTENDFFSRFGINWAQWVNFVDFRPPLPLLPCHLYSTTAYLNHHQLHLLNSTPRSVPRIAHGACNVTAFSSLLKPFPDLIRPPCVSIIQPSESEPFTAPTISARNSTKRISSKSCRKNVKKVRRPIHEMTIGVVPKSGPWPRSDGCEPEESGCCLSL